MQCNINCAEFPSLCSVRRINIANCKYSSTAVGKSKNLTHTGTVVKKKANIPCRAIAEGDLKADGPDIFFAVLDGKPPVTSVMGYSRPAQIGGEIPLDIVKKTTGKYVHMSAKTNVSRDVCDMRSKGSTAILSPRKTEKFRYKYSSFGQCGKKVGRRSGDGVDVCRK